MNQQHPEEVSLGGGNIEAPATVEEEKEQVQHKQEETESTDPIVVVAEEKSADGEKEDDNTSTSNMEIDPVSPATVFCVKLKQPNSNLLHKMSVPELCRNFRFDSFSDRKVLRFHLQTHQFL